MEKILLRNWSTKRKFWEYNIQFHCLHNEIAFNTKFTSFPKTLNYPTDFLPESLNQQLNKKVIRCIVENAKSTLLILTFFGFHSI